MNELLLQEEKTAVLIDVAIPLPIDDPFTYQLPPALEGKVQPGMRVLIPFRNRSLTGYVTTVDVKREVKKPKDILEILDPEPVLDDHFLRLGKWIRDYYFCSWGEALQNMVPKIFKSKPEEASFDEKDEQKLDLSASNRLSLNEEQKKAFESIQKAFSQNKFKEFFLHGVTGGGKSELYIRAIKEVLREGKSAICLVPEIALTEQLKHFFVEHFHEQLEILHSKLTDRERWLAWRRIRSGKKKVILGARSCIFAPTPNLGLIIMDEEQEGSYKQDQAPRYHAREVARWRAQDLGIVFLMGTATPTLETMYRVKQNEIEFLELSKRFDGRAMPKVDVIDLKTVQDIKKSIVIVSPPMKRAIEEALQQKNGVLLLLNRRGFSTHIRCLSCTTVLNCSHCEVALTFHQEDQKLLCHYCNEHKEVPAVCPSCKHPLFKFSGLGTEKVESEVGRLFPQARIARLDADTVKKRGSHDAILKQFRNREIDILVGTQMIAKGFDFPHVTLAGIVNADTGLLLPDFRSSERTFQLLTQMAGRAGRGKEVGKVLIQTYSPDHYAIKAAAKHEYMTFYNEEITRRQNLSYPPFKHLINFMIRGKLENKTYQTAYEMAQILKKLLTGTDLEMVGPAPLPFYRLRGHFRWHIMLKGDEFISHRSLIESAMEQLRVAKGVFLAIDVDPLSIL